MPGSPGSPFAPFGIVKLKTAALDVPELVTDALVPGFPVVVVPTAIVAAAPGLPGVPGLPWSPLGPLSPRGIVKFKTAALADPVLVTDALVPGAPVEVEPTVIAAATPGSPFSPFGPPVFLSLKYAFWFLAVIIGRFIDTSILVSGTVVTTNFGLTVLILNLAMPLTP